MTPALTGGAAIALGYLVMSVVAFVAYGIDKRAAREGGRRISEATLLMMGLLGGWPGALLAQRRFRHKTRKQPFRTLFWLSVVTNVALVAAGWMLLQPLTASASAGGGVGGGFGGGGFGGSGHGGDSAAPPWQVWAFWAALAATVAGVWYFFSIGAFQLRAGRVRDQLSRAAGGDPMWDAFEIEKRTSRAFEAVQQAWAERRLGAAHEHLTPECSEELARRLDDLTTRGRRNVMEGLRRRSARIVGYRSARDMAPDTVWVWFEAQLYDYIIDEDSGLLVDGSAANKRRLREVWTFVRVSGRWVVDEIEQKPHVGQLALLPHSLSQGAK